MPIPKSKEKKKSSEWPATAAMLLAFVGFLFGLHGFDAFLSNQVMTNNFLVYGLSFLFGTSAYIYGIIYLWKRKFRLALIGVLIVTIFYAIGVLNTYDRWGFGNPAQLQYKEKELEHFEVKATGSAKQK